MGPQGEEIVEATNLAARLGSAIVDIEVRCAATVPFANCLCLPHSCT